MSVTMTWRVLIFRIEKRSAEMDGSCEYIKQRVPNRSQMVVHPALCLSEELKKFQLKNLQFEGIIHNGVVRAILVKVMDLPVQQYPGNSSNTWGTVRFLRTALFHAVSSVDLLT